MTLRAVFFDLDGTLLDTAPNLCLALNRLLVAKKQPPLPKELVRSVVSDGAYAMLKLAFNVDINDEETPALRQALLDYYLEDLASQTVAFPGIEALIKKLDENSIAWGIVTNKPNTYAEPLMTEFPFAKSSLCLICPDHVKDRKPAPEALFLACEKAGCKPSEAIYVGDHLRDVQCGQRANMPTIAAAFGYLSKDVDVDQWGANYVAYSGQDIWPIIKDNFL